MFSLRLLRGSSSRVSVIGFGALLVALAVGVPRVVAQPQDRGNADPCATVDPGNAADTAACKALHDSQRHVDPIEELNSGGDPDSTTSIPAVPCYNNSKGDYYIVNVYAWAATSVGGYGDRYSTEAGVARNKVQRADYHLDVSADNQDQHYRVLCDTAGTIAMWKMQIDPSKDGTPSSVSDYDVRKTGYDLGHTNRNYIYFYWSDHPGLSGNFSCIGSCPKENSTSTTTGVRMPLDGRGGNGWKAYSFGHETGHAIDAVNANSPHGTNGRHCGDGRHQGHAYPHNFHDLMCYNDGSSDFVPVDTCATQNPWFVDCNKDDYWKPSSTSMYMADASGNLTVFNTARSIWLSSVCSEATTQNPLSCQQADGRFN